MLDFIISHRWSLATIALLLVVLYVLYDAVLDNTTLCVRVYSNLNETNSHGAVHFRTTSGNLYPVFFVFEGKQKPNALSLLQLRDVCDQVRKLSITPYSMAAAVITLYVEGDPRTFLVPKTA